MEILHLIGLCPDTLLHIDLADILFFFVISAKDMRAMYIKYLLTKIYNYGSNKKVS
jgi:hypothetical protein